MILEARAQHLLRATGELYVYRSESAYRAALPAHALRRRHGVEVEDLPRAALRQFEPSLAPIFTRAVFLPHSISTTSPYALTKALGKAFVAGGGEIRREEITDVEIAQRRLVALHGTGGRRIVNRVVIALGAHAKLWLSKFGSPAPLDTERGYHLMVSDPGVALTRPVILGDQRVGLCSMLDGLRIAGTAELATLEAPANYRRANRLIALAQNALPDMHTSNVTPWMGQGPSSPDSLPVIGHAPNLDNVFYAFAHGHLGLTLGAITGRMIADLAADRTPSVDVGPFDIRRFTTRAMSPPKPLVSAAAQGSS